MSANRCNDREGVFEKNVEFVFLYLHKFFYCRMFKYSDFALSVFVVVWVYFEKGLVTLIDN